MKQQPELTVEEVSTESLIPYARNAKIHTNEQIDQICESIGEFGFNDPVAVWDGPDGPEIIEGHGRVMAAKKLGLDVVPVVRLDHLSDEQRRAYGIVHNKLTMNTGWDFAKLEEELEDLQSLDIDFDMEDFGFDAVEFADGAMERGGAYEELTPEELEAYGEAADSGCLKSFNVVISCLNDDDKKHVAEILGEEDAASLKRFYKAEELL